MGEGVVEFPKIAATPGIGRARRDLLHNKVALFWPVADYLVVCRLKRGTVRILAIVHAVRIVLRVLARREN